MIFQRIAEIANAAPSGSGLRENGVTNSYADLYGRAERLAAGFQSIGIGKGDTVAIFIPNSVDIWVVSHALFALGAITVSLNPQANPVELKTTGERCRLKAVVARPEYLAAADRLNADLGGGLLVVQTGDNGPFSVASLEKHAPVVLAPVDPDADAFYLFSSGSTGRSKIVPWTHAQMIAACDHVVVSTGLQPDDRSINGLPSYTSYGYMTAVGGDMFGHATTVFWSDPQPILLSRGRMLATVEAERITRFPAVPFLCDVLAGIGDNVDVSSLRWVSTGGVALKKPTFDRFLERFGIPVRQALGMSEAMLISSNEDADPVPTWASVGRPHPLVTVEIRPVPESPSPDMGEIFVSKPGMTAGYKDVDPEVNAVFTDGGMLTGDLGRIGDDGHLYITGRIKFIVEVSGMKVDPIEVEDVLLTHPAIADAVVIGVPDPRTGEQRLKAVVVKKADETADNIIRYSRTKLTPYKVPALVEFRDQIPRNGAGKVMRTQLAD